MFPFQTCNERIILLVRQLELIMTPHTANTLFMHYRIRTDRHARRQLQWLNDHVKIGHYANTYTCSRRVHQ